MATPVLKNVFVSDDLAEFLSAEQYGKNFVLAAGVPQFFTVPTYANNCIFASTGDFWIRYFKSTDSSNIALTGTEALGTGWSKAGSTLNASAGTASSAVYTPIPANLTPGVPYLVTATFTISAGSFKSVIGGTNGTTRTASGTYSEVIVAGSGTDTAFYKDASGAGSVSSITIRECAYEPTVTSPDDGRASYLNPIKRQFDDITGFSLYSTSGAKGSIAYFKGA